MLILLTGLNSIDPELFDAAKTMGASLFKRIFAIVIPLIISIHIGCGASAIGGNVERVYFSPLCWRAGIICWNSYRFFL
jgi:ABC-type polysaccharide transport system permease subunit